MRTQRNAEMVLGVVVLAASAAYFAAARAIPASLLDDVVGSRGLPTVYAVMLAVLGLAQIARAAIWGGAGAPQTNESKPSHRKTVGLLAIGAAYGALLPWLGYPGSIALLIAATAAHQGAGINARVVAVAVGGAAFMWALFVWLLGIPQPAGIWPEL